MKGSRARHASRRSESSRLRALGPFLAGLAVAAVAGPLCAVAAGAGPTGGGGITTSTTAKSTTPTRTSPGTTTTDPPPVISPGPAGSPFAARGMWIWVLGSTDGGDVSTIIAQARAYGIKTLMIKSGDGTGMWSQFNPTLVSELHRAGLHVCAWQFVYGQSPKLEAEVGAEAVHDGADCLLIDAETQYQGEYVQAQTYMTTLRRLVGARFPLALAGFPYVDYHPSFPYSVFLGPGGAQYNIPQMYWKDIGTTVQAVYQHTYEFNELYQRPIAPLGQLYDNPSPAAIRSFRSLSRLYGASNVSWWDWQSAASSDFKAISQPVGRLPGDVAETTVATLGENAMGDVVVWAQEHLAGAGEKVTIDGDFGPSTEAAVLAFQAAKGLAQTGFIDPPTWSALLRYRPVAVKWVVRKQKLTASVARSGGPEVLLVPSSARLKARRDELAGAGGQGRPR
jgi:hypothetical protein